MHNRLANVGEEACQVAYDEHMKQSEHGGSCAGSSPEMMTPFIPVSGKQHQMPVFSNEEGEVVGNWHDRSLLSALVDKVPASSSVPVCTLNFSSSYAENTKEVCFENAKRLFSSNCFSEEVVFFKRARQEEKMGTALETSSEEPGKRIASVEEEARVDHLRFFSSCSRSSQLEDLCAAPFSEFCYRRLVPIGPDHQAKIPEWSSVELDAARWLGTPVLPLTRSGAMMLARETQSRRNGLGYDDVSSISCVRRQVMMARKSLESSVGHEKFVALGFCDMGEVVAEGWTDEEESMFREVVLACPASMGRNFWPVLALALPSRSTKDLVSYYFNVFVLRKRADQNRSDPSNADSDNDEWRDTSDDDDDDDDDFGEYALSGEEEENSLVESPTEGGHEGYGGRRFANSDEDEFYSGSDGCVDFGLDPKHADDRDVQDDSCTSFEGQFNAVDTCGGGGGGGKDGRLAESKLWETNYVGRIMEKEIEFLPTSHVIEELLGNECVKEDRDGYH